MPITDADVKLMEPERLTDYEDGGGRMTGNEVVDGVINNLFPDISRLDRAYGRVSLRKAYAAVQTADDDPYYGAHAILTDPPDDPRVSSILFTTKDYADLRASARDFVERYVVQGPESRMVLYGDALVGSQAIAVYQLVGEPLPEVGEVYLLSIEKAGYTPHEQYVRIARVEHEVRTFTDNTGSFDRRVIQLLLDNRLNYTFPGITPTRYTAHGSPTLIRVTQVADAARYYTAMPLENDADIGEFEVKVVSPYGQIVPSTQRDSPLTDVPLGGAYAMAPSAPEINEYRNNAYPPPLANFLPTVGALAYLGTGVIPGSLSLECWGDYTPKTTTKDTGFGELRRVGDNALMATIDYELGLLVNQKSNTYGDWGPIVYTQFRYKPAAAVRMTRETSFDPITIQNRGTVYIKTLHPIPTLGSVQVDFRALGKWYRLREVSTGILQGLTLAEGSGTINYQSGTVVVTLGALPDVDSAIIWSWGVNIGATQRSGTGVVQPPDVPIQLSFQNVVPGSVSVTWQTGGQTKTATDAGGTGVLSGHGTGRIVYSTGALSVKPTLLYDSNAVFTVSYQQAANQTDVITQSVSDQIPFSTTLTHAPIRPRSLQLTVHHANRTYVVTDNGAGGLIGNCVPENSSINYATGQLVCQVTSAPGYWKGVYETYTSPVCGNQSRRLVNWEWVTLLTSGPQGNATATITYVEDSATNSNQQDEATAPPLKLDLTPTISDDIVPNSIQFTLGGRTYYDREGTLYYGLNAQTGGGTSAGTVDYSGGLATITNWAGGQSNAVIIKAMATYNGKQWQDSIQMRIPGAPLRPGSFYCQVVAQDTGELITTTSDMSGNLVGDYYQGHVDQLAGWMWITYGRRVLDSTLTAEQKAEAWYNPANIEPDGRIWVPRSVYPDTFRFNAVVLSHIPLDPDVLGLDPVRLPMDGRVPTIRPGDLVVLATSRAYQMPGGLSAGQIVQLPEVKLASVVLVDQAAAVVPTDRYTLDLPLGKVTMADPLNLSGYTQPLIASYTVEDMSICADMQITGHITLSAALEHAYPAGAYLSSGLIMGDLQARYQYLFSQSSWTGVWQDTRIGSAPTGQYNEVSYPIQVTNEGATKERWRINFTSSTAFQVIGETLGVVATGTTSADCTPINPKTNKPYFQILAAGWGAGWATGNQLRFNTLAANYPIWLARTVLSGGASLDDDSFRIQIRGDAN